ncbi:MAG: VCBS repeat-containing protein, partial [Ignavibacteriae bacterium]|nr:VCBS repeat-containing protein [Ignavibacteriota bacterium]
VAWGAYDNDGDLDILVTGASQTAAVSKIYQNTGGGFTEVYAGSLPGVFYSSVAWGDYDNDGDLDILITGYDGNTEVHISKIYQNTGIGFTEAFEANLVAVQQGSVAWGDYDNDGDLDILLTGGFDYSGNDYDTQYAKIYRNSTIPPFNLSQQNEATFNVGPTAPTGLTATRSGNSISFKWNRATDPNTPSPGLTYNLRIGTTANGVNVQSPMADVASGYRRVVRMGNTNHDTSWTIHNLDTTQTYYWSVQALNHSSGSSAFFPEKTFAFTYTLTANATNGSISRSPDQPSYNSGSQVIVSATPATGYNFVNWSGDLSGSENPDTLTMDANKTVTANFAINTYSLSVSGDYGAVTKDPNQESFDHGTTAQVSQTADRGYIFTGWSGDATGTDNPLTVMMDGNKSIQANYEIDPDYENLYRTAKYETWALAKDGKNKLLSVKRKADKVFFKFNLVADSTRILYLEFPAEASGAITFGKLKTDTLVNFTTTKKKFRDTLMTISMGDTIQVDGVAKQGKKVQVKYAWGKAKAVTMKADSLYKINHVGLPMPNLHNIGEELFPKGFGQANAYFANGLLVGIPQGLKKANSVIHPKYADVQKSFVKGIKNGNRLHSDSLTARCLDSLDGTKKKAMSSQQKSLPPDKMDNKLFAEVLTLKLNIAASATEKFPAGIGQLTFDDPSNGSNPFNEMMVDSIVIKADSMLSCLNTSTGATLSELYETVQLINCAFADTTIDTLSFGSKTKFTGVKSLFEVDYLQPTPGIPPRIVQTFAEISDVVPERFELSQNYPNPFNPSTVIRYSLPVNSRVTLKMYDMLGREVASLVNEMQDAGFKMLEWNVGSLPSGIYFYRLTATGVEDNSRKFVEVNKMILLK